MALESARTGVRRCRADVESTRIDLNTGYKGSDGRAYSELIGDWETQVDKILGNLDEMIVNLQTNVQEVNRNQQAVNEAINNARATGNPTYHALMGR
ncbi:hypothetical protein ABTX77_30225 [Streptomyces sp. NPDC097704]|uniref:hypothetical protein n=1 Tax=Streptomyces sp. NPDC097704 TaxID=3157101 RepID=UPI0033302AF5